MLHERHFVAAAAAGAASGAYATVDSVTRAVCTSHGVLRIEQLGVTIASSPCLSLLLHIEQCVAHHVAAFLSTHGIATFRDLEQQVVSALRSLCTPPLAAPQGGQPSLTSFDSYGAGPLSRHPAVRAAFGDGFVSSAGLSYSDVAQHLLTFLTERNLSSGHRSGAASPAVDSAAFGRFLEQQAGRSLRELGVVIVPAALPAVVHALRHSTHALAELQVNATKLAVERLHARPEYKQLAEARAGPQSHTRRQAQGRQFEPSEFGGSAGGTEACGTSAAAPGVPKLRPPNEPTLARVVTTCRTLIGSGYAPTWTAMRAVVERMATPEAPKGARKVRRSSRVGGGDGDGGGGGGGGGNVGAPLPAAGGACDEGQAETCVLNRDALLLLATEYLMLHAARSKWRARKFEQPAEKAAETGGAAATSASDSSDDSSDDSSSDSDDSDDSDDSGDSGEAEPEGRDEHEQQRPEGRAASAEGRGDESQSDAAADAKVSSSSARRRKRRRGGGEAASEVEVEAASQQADMTASGAAEAAAGAEAEAAAEQPALAAEQRTAAQPAAHACDPNEIELDEDTPTGAAAASSVSDGRRPLDGGSTTTQAHALRVTVDVSRRANTAVAPLPHRLASGRSATADGARGVDPAALAAGGCLPWSGALAVTEPLDTSDHRSVGRWGEALVYNYLLSTLPASRSVAWLNAKEETCAPYDLTVTERGGGAAHAKGGGATPTVFIEVKSTRYADNNVFELSYFEWEFMREPHVRFHIYRVSAVGDPARTRITIIEDPLQAVQDGRIRLCMAV